MIELVVVAIMAAIIAVIAAYAFVEYAKIKYGSETVLQKMEGRLQDCEKHVKLYNADRIRDKVHDLERRTGSGF